MKGRAVIVMTILGVVLAPNREAEAQRSPGFDISAGYTMLRDGAVDETLHGWAVAATAYVRPVFGLTGEISAGRQADGVLGTRLQRHVVAIMAGPRIRFMGSRRLSPFGQVLFGGIRSTVGILESSVESVAPGWQPGAGADLKVNDHLAVRIGADYRLPLDDDARAADRRVFAGLVLGTR